MTEGSAVALPSKSSSVKNKQGLSQGSCMDNGLSRGNREKAPLNSHIQVNDQGAAGGRGTGGYHTSSPWYAS